MSRHCQKGAVVITVALCLLFLLGFMGIALDFGRLFIVKTELQTAMDSCALAAAQELDGAGDAQNRARSAGKTAGNLNKVYFQQAFVGILDAEISFSDSLIGSYSQTFIPLENAKYAKCTHIKSGIAPWLLQAMGAFSGNSDYGKTQSVFALGVATRASAQTTCMLPIGICDKPGGFQPGEWVQGAVGSGDALTGQFHWLDFTGNPGGANDVKALLQGPGQCSLPGADSVVRESGNIGSAAFAYNTRFGIYKDKKVKLPDDGIPDLTGYAYYNDTVTQPPYPSKYSDFIEKRAVYAKYQGDDNKKKPGCSTCDNPQLNNIVPPGNIYDGSLATSGTNRRIVTAPIVSCPIPNSSSTPVKINSVACILMLHPIKSGAGANSEKMWIEYIGAANDQASPCSTFGLAGGDGGPLVPVLVQ
jgi:hypothetical protein